MDAVQATIPDAIINRLGVARRPVAWTPAGVLRILVVDSQRSAAEQLAGLLLEQGHKVRCARRGAEALVVGEELQPHMALIEIGGVSGQGCPTSVLLRCRPWAEHLVLIGHSRYGSLERDHRELLHHEFPGELELEQLLPIYENLLLMRGLATC